MPSLLLLVKPDDGPECKALDAEACEAALSPVSVTMDDLDEKSALLAHEDTIMDYNDYSSDAPDTDFNDASTACSRVMSDDEYSDESLYNFWVIPPEIRTMIYENLLLSDSAFRLGHHGPYSHERRRQLCPQILRTCSTVYEEASSVLYGDNTFYLGPIGHKPTYSASFVTSIGAHNARKIRTLVAHSTHPASLTDRYLRNWIASFGLDVTRIRSLALSFSAESTTSEDEFNPALIPTTTTVAITPASAMQGLTVPGQHQHANFVFLPPVMPNQQLFNANTVTTLILNPATLPAPITVVGSSPLPPTPGNHVATLTSSTVPFVATVGSNFNGTLPSVLDIANNESDGVPLQQDIIWMQLVQRMSGWGFMPAGEAEVDRWVVRKNTDLRAGDRWLIYVSPSTRQQRVLQY